MVRDVAHRRRPTSTCWSPSPSPAARCATRSPAGSPAPSRALDGVDDGRPRLHRDDRRGARGRCASSCTATRRHRRQPARARPRRGPGDPVRRARLEDPAAADRLGQGRRRQVVASPRTSPSPWPSRATRSASSTPTSTASRSRACSAPTATPVVHRRDARAAGGHGACAASRWATSCQEDQAVIWRGPMLHKALEQFLTDVYWDEPDFLLVDMPPGTGDIAISPRQYLPRGRGLRRHHAAAGGPEGRPRCRRRWPQKVQPRRSRASSRTCSGSPATTASATSCSAPAAAAELAERARRARCSARCRCVPALREGGDDGRPIVAVEPDSEAARRSARSPSASPSSWPRPARYHPELKLI